MLDDDRVPDCDEDVVAERLPETDAVIDTDCVVSCELVEVLEGLTEGVWLPL